VVLVTCGFDADPALAWVLARLAVVAGVAWYAMLCGVLVAGGRTRC
jgi:hypothetical protein